MTAKEIHNLFSQEFDLVGIIRTSEYNKTANALNKNTSGLKYPTMVVLGLAYPKRLLKHSKTHLVPSFYTFGKDYHLVMKEKIQKICDTFSFKYEYGVDNHPLDERLAAQISGLGFLGKNQLIINKDYGSYMFLAMVSLDNPIHEDIKYTIDDDCGSCRKCIEACPTNALTDDGYVQNKCISNYNQTKKVLTKEEIEKNYCLFGCDICQLVCPKNINKGKIVHPGFELSGKEMVSILDLFELSQKEFNKKYSDMAYTWKGKTILMRNALTLLYNHNNTDYNDLIQESINKYPMPWYQETAKFILNKLENIK
ncbi:MAG: epoxyqueuosine reductase [Candidatus Izemoplasmatales bacterium]